MTPDRPGPADTPSEERITGRLEGWNPQRGFGFLHPEAGGEAAFAHIRAFAKDDRLIEEGHLYSYTTHRNEKGRLRAEDIRPLRPAQPEPPPRQAMTDGRLPERIARRLILPAFLFIVFAISLTAQLSWLWLIIYGVASGVTFIGYRLDKRAAETRSWRVSETILLLLGLAGGWPGAILAQELYRHKTRKAAFRLLFWISTAINIAGFVQISVFSAV